MNLTALNFLEIAVGIAGIFAGFVVLRVGSPGPDGKVRRWLSTDTLQASYAIFILALFLGGISFIVTGVVPG